MTAKLTALVALFVLASLTACSPAQQTAAPTTSHPPGVRLSTPPASDSNQVNVVVESYGLPAGTKVSLFAYGDGWSTAPPATCTGTDPITTAIITKDGPTTVPATLPGPGVWSWVLAAPDHTTPCGAESPQTLVKIKTTVSLGAIGGRDIYQSLDEWSNPIPTARPFAFNVIVGTGPVPATPPQPWNISVKWYGPFSGEPEAISAGCTENAPVALTASATATEPSKLTAVSVTPTEPGLYRVVAETAGTAQVLAGSSGCDDDSPFLVVK